MAAAEAAKAPAKVSRADAFWFVLYVVNAGLLLWLVPDKLLKSDALDLLSGKVAPWIATSLFVTGYTWWRDEMLYIARSRWCQLSQIPLFVLLAFFEVPFVVVRAELSPPDAELIVDGNRADRIPAHWHGASYEHELRLLFRPHQLEVKRPALSVATDTGNQSVELGWLDMFDAVASGRKFAWSLAWPVTLSFPVCPTSRIIVVRDGAFDSNYLETWARSEAIRPVSQQAPYLDIKDWDGRSEVRAVEIPLPEDKSVTTKIRIPAGKYRFVAVRSDAPEPVPATVSYRQSSVVVKLPPCPPPPAEPSRH